MSYVILCLTDDWWFYFILCYNHNITRCILKKKAQKIACRMCWNESFISALHKRPLWFISPAKAKQQPPPKLAVQRDYRFDAPDKRWPGLFLHFFLSKCPLMLEQFSFISGKMRGRPDQSQWHKKDTAAESCKRLVGFSSHKQPTLILSNHPVCKCVCIGHMWICAPVPSSLSHFSFTGQTTETAS